MDEHLKQLLLLGREHYQKRELDKAEPMLRQVLESSDRMADVHDMLGVCPLMMPLDITRQCHYPLLNLDRDAIGGQPDLPF